MGATPSHEIDRRMHRTTDRTQCSSNNNNNNSNSNSDNSNSNSNNSNSNSNNRSHLAPVTNYQGNIPN